MDKSHAMGLGSSLVLACIVSILACRATPSGTERQTPPAQPAELDHINASVTGTPGQYHVLPVFERLTQVYVVQRESPSSGARKVLTAPGDYTFDAQSGALALASRIDDQKELIVVEGVRHLPLSWQVGEAIEADSVRSCSASAKRSAVEISR